MRPLHPATTAELIFSPPTTTTDSFLSISVSLTHSLSQSVSQSVGLSVCLSVSLSLSQSAGESKKVRKLAGWLVSQSASLGVIVVGR